MAETKDLAEKDYMNGMKYKDIAAKYNVSLNTVKSWKVRCKWDKKSMHTKDKKVCTQKSKKDAAIKEPIASAITELENSELNDKQRLFCYYYVKYRNKTKAYMKAYQCSYEAANANAYKIWSNMVIKNEIDRQLKELRDELKLDAQDIIQKYIDIAFADINDYVQFGQEEIVVGKDDKGKEIKRKFNTVKFNESTDVDGTIISEVSQGRDGTKIKLYDKTKALDWLANHMDLLDTATKERLKLEQRRMELAEKESNDKDEDADILYEVMTEDED